MNKINKWMLIINVDSCKTNLWNRNKKFIYRVWKICRQIKTCIRYINRKAHNMTSSSLYSSNNWFHFKINNKRYIIFIVVSARFLTYQVNVVISWGRYVFNDIRLTSNVTQISNNWIIGKAMTLLVLLEQCNNNIFHWCQGHII